MISPITKRARELRNNPTEAEKTLWKALKICYPELKFRRQYPIGPYFADIACKYKRLIIEVDGGQHDFSSVSEQKRTACLQEHGYRVVRFWNNDVLNNIEGVMTQIEDFLNGAPPLTPPQAGGNLIENFIPPRKRGGRGGETQAARNMKGTTNALP
jgi:very-short-patch-repair endonuclease